MLVADFTYLEMPKDNFFFGMYTRQRGSKHPKDFEIFDFIIDAAPDSPYEIFHIPTWLIFKAGH
jgi:hypothetical protein